MKSKMFFSSVLLFLLSSLYPLYFQPVFTDITGDVICIRHGAVTNLSNYGYFFVLPDSGLVYYNTSGDLVTFNAPNDLPIISASCKGSSYVTDKIYCATGIGSESDALYEFNTVTENFTLKEWTGRPNFVKYLSSGFYFGSEWDLQYSGDDGSTWNDIDYFTNYDVTDIQQTGSGALFAAATKLGKSNAAIVMMNGEEVYEYETMFSAINDVYVRAYPNNDEVYVTLGNGTYSDGLYQVLYNDSTITGLELIDWVMYPGLIIEYDSCFILTDVQNGSMTAIPFSTHEAVNIYHGLDITRIYCISNQFPIYTPNFLIGTDKGVHMVTGSVNGIEDNPQIPAATVLHQNYPNPFNPVTQIKFDLVKAGKVQLNVYNVNGQKISELINSKMNAGAHSVEFDGSMLNTGVYYYTLKTEEKSYCRKMLIVK